MDSPPEINSKYEPSSSTPSVTGSNTVSLPDQIHQTLADTYPSTSAAGQVELPITSYPVNQLRRRRFTFRLSAVHTKRLLRIVSKQPIALKRLGELLLLHKFFYKVIFAALDQM